MNKILSIVLLGLLAISFAAESKWEIDQDVLVLTTKNFDDAINEHQYILVEFYAPWCGHCKSLAPEYAKAAQTLKKQGSEIKLAKVDATEQGELGQKFGVKGYPTLKFFVDGHATEYKGGRVEKDIVEWLKKKAQPKLRAVKNVDDFEDEIRENDVVAILWATNAHKYFPIFESISRSFDEVEFIYTNDDETREKYQSDEDVLITIYKRFDEGRVDYEGVMDLEKIKEWVGHHQFPIVMDFTDKAAERIFGQQTQPGFLLFVDPQEETDESDNAANTFREVATEMKGKAFFAIVDVHGSESHRIMEFFGVKTDNVPTMRIAASGGHGFEKFRTTNDELTKQNMEAFLNDYLEGKIRSYLKSEPIPEDKGDAVKTVVAQNWKKVVLDPTKDVLVEIYAPWCGHCQKLSPIYEKAAKRLAKIPNVVLAKFDATANEVDGVQVQSYPTLKWYPAFKKHAPVEAKFDHTEEGIIDYVTKHLTKKYTGDSGEL